MGALGAFFPFYGLYLRENIRLSGFQVGAVFATLPLLGFFVQPLWGIVADRSGFRVRVLIILSAGSCLGYFCLWYAHEFPMLLLATAALAFFSRALIPITLSVSLAALEEDRTRFGFVRAFGTAGFLMAVVSIPSLVGQKTPVDASISAPLTGFETGLGLLFPVAASLMFGATLIALNMPKTGGTLALRSVKGEWRTLFSVKPFLRMTTVGFLAFLFLHGPMDIFPIYIRNRGGGLEIVRNMWLLMLIPEIALMTLLGAGVRHLGPRGIVLIGIVAGGLRWILMSQVTSLAMIYPLQILHALTVTGLFLGGPLYLDATIPPQLRSTGQAFYSMAGMGLGGTCSSLLTGWLLGASSINTPYLVGGLGALVLAFSAWFFLPKPIPPKQTEAQ